MTLILCNIIALRYFSFEISEPGKQVIISFFSEKLIFRRRIIYVPLIKVCFKKSKTAFCHLEMFPHFFLKIKIVFVMLFVAPPVASCKLVSVIHLEPFLDCFWPPSDVTVARILLDEYVNLARLTSEPDSVIKLSGMQFMDLFYYFYRDTQWPVGSRLTEGEVTW